MKLIVVVLGLVAAVLATDVNYDPPIFKDYHEEIGIPEATRIKLAEASIDFDGSRITGGTPSLLGSQPFLGGLIILLSDGRQSVCGSSLLTSTRAVTAAHCWLLRSGIAVQLTVVLGSVLLFSGGTRVVTNNVQPHANYNPNNLNNDIAIITIPTVGFNDNVRPVALASGNNLFVGTWATAAGFGAQADNRPITQGQTKHQVNLQVITNGVCQRTYGFFVVVSSTICVATSNGQSTCGGDSGGPLTANIGGTTTLIGITSFGHRNGCELGFPAGFARVTAFLNWIQARI